MQVSEHIDISFQTIPAPISKSSPPTSLLYATILGLPRALTNIIYSTRNIKREMPEDTSTEPGGNRY